MVRNTYLLTVLLFLLSPFLLLFFYLFQYPHFFTNETPIHVEELLVGFKITFFQSAISGLGALVLGFFYFLGLLSIKTKWVKSLFEIIILLPNLFPQLFIVLSLVNLFEKTLGFIPFGFWGVVASHTIVYAGLVALSLSRTVTEKMGKTLDLAIIEGAGRWQLIYVGIIKRFKKEIYSLFLFVFTLCFTSFTIPFLMGQGLPVLEIQIYENIRIEQNWSQALIIVALESLFVLTLALLYQTSPSHESIKKWSGVVSQYVGIRSFNFFTIIMILFLLLGVTLGFYRGLVEVVTDTPFVMSLFNPIYGTLLIGFGSGALTFFLFLWLGWCWPIGKIHYFLMAYVAPSSAITGFAYLLWGENGFYSSLVKIILGFTLMSVAGLYRFYGFSFFSKLNRQIDVAKTLGASRRAIYKKIIFPQIVDSVGFVSGLTAFWICGDFALSTILAYNDITLALVIKNLIQTYRFDQATFLVWIMLACGAFCYFIFGGLGHVLSRKSHL